MLQELMAELQPAIISIAVTVLTAIGSYIGIKIKQFLEEKINTETKKKVVETTCRAVEQIYKDLDGPAKLEKAQKDIVEQLNEKGITVSELELRILIEAAVNAMKKELTATSVAVTVPTITTTDTVTTTDTIIEENK